MSDWTPEITPEIAADIGGSAMESEGGGVLTPQERRVVKRATQLFMELLEDPDNDITKESLILCIQAAAQEDYLLWGTQE
jgi:hypothetical protein